MRKTCSFNRFLYQQKRITKSVVIHAHVQSIIILRTLYWNYIPTRKHMRPNVVDIKRRERQGMWANSMAVPLRVLLLLFLLLLLS